MYFRKSLIQLMAVLLVALPVLGVAAGKAQAATSRVAVIKEMTGTVQVKKAGGSKQFKAFARMSLNEGDVLTTGANSSAVLQFSNGTSEDDKMSVAAKTTLTFSKLSDRKGTRTKVSMFNGTAWVDVKSIASKDDEFTLETPTAVMGVRGTHLLVSVDPESGATKLTVAAGVVNTQPTVAGADPVSVKPGDNALITKDSKDNGDLTIAPADLELLIGQSDPSIVEAIIAASGDIVKENEEKMDQYFEGEPSGQPSENDRKKSNVENLLGAIVDQAVKSGLISQERANQLVAEAETQTGVKIDLSKKELQLSDDEKKKQEEQRLKDEEAKKLAETEKKRQEEERKRNEELNKKLEAERKAKEDANKKAEEEKKKKAEAEYQKQLDDAAKKRFEDEQKKRAEDEAKAKAAASAVATRSPSPSPIITPSPTPSQTSTTTPVLSSNANLSGLTLSRNNGTTDVSLTLSPAFNASHTEYTAIVAHDTKQVKLTPTVADTGRSTVTVNTYSHISGSAKSVTLNAAGMETMIEVEVRAENGTTKKYTVTVAREAHLVEASDVNIPAVPGFDPDVTQYTLSPVLSTTDSIPMTFGNAESFMQIEVNVTDEDENVTTLHPEPGEPFDVPLQVGDNTITVALSIPMIMSALTMSDITATSVQTYTFIVNRQPSSIATLSALTLNGVSIPNFDPADTEYTVEVSYATATSSVVAVTTHAGAEAAIAGNGPLNVGSNTVTVTVTAQDGTVVNYVITVIRKSNDDYLTGFGQGDIFTLNTTFARDKLDYTSTVAYNMGSVAVLPWTSDPNATVKVFKNDTEIFKSGLTPYVIPLTVGSDNTVKVEVTSQDGTKRTYTIVITRLAQSADATLAGISVNGQPIPNFHPDTVSYTVDVAPGTGSADIDPNVNQLAATFHISGPSILSDGDNPFTITVTAQNGTTTKIYTVNVKRTVPSTYLSEIATDFSFSPSFNKNQLTYSATLPNSMPNLVITPILEDSNANIVVKFNEVITTVGAHGSYSGFINVGMNTIKIEVYTKYDPETPRVYSFNIERQSSTITDLEHIAVSKTADPDFQYPVFHESDGIGKSVFVASAVDQVKLNLTPLDHEAQVIITSPAALAGTYPYGVAIPNLTLGSAGGITAVDFKVRSTAGTEQTYQLKVHRLGGGQGSSANITGLSVKGQNIAPSGNTYTATVTTAAYAAMVLSYEDISFGPFVKVSRATHPEEHIQYTNDEVYGNGYLIPLEANKAPTTVTIEVTSLDSETSQTYTLTINQTDPVIGTNPTLSQFTVFWGPPPAVMGDLSVANWTYTQYVPFYTDYVGLSFETIDEDATVSVKRADGSTSGITLEDSVTDLVYFVSLTNDLSNVINVYVKAGNGTEKIYTLELMRESGPEPDLASLNAVFVDGSKFIGFDPASETETFIGVVSHDLLEMEFETAFGANTSVYVSTVDLTTVEEPDNYKVPAIWLEEQRYNIPLEPGNNFIYVSVQAESSESTKEYVFRVSYEKLPGATVTATVNGEPVQWGLAFERNGYPYTAKKRYQADVPDDADAITFEVQFDSSVTEAWINDVQVPTENLGTTLSYPLNGLLPGYHTFSVSYTRTIGEINEYFDTEYTFLIGPRTDEDGHDLYADYTSLYYGEGLNLMCPDESCEYDVFETDNGYTAELIHYGDKNLSLYVDTMEPASFVRVWQNGQEVHAEQYGYRFDLDLKSGGNHLLVRVYDPTGQTYADYLLDVWVNLALEVYDPVNTEEPIDTIEFVPGQENVSYFVPNGLTSVVLKAPQDWGGSVTVDGTELTGEPFSLAVLQLNKDVEFDIDGDSVEFHTIQFIPMPGGITEFNSKSDFKSVVDWTYTSDNRYYAILDPNDSEIAISMETVDGVTPVINGAPYSYYWETNYFSLDAGMNEINIVVGGEVSRFYAISGDLDSIRYEVDLGNGMTDVYTTVGTTYDGKTYYMLESAIPGSIVYYPLNGDALNSYTLTPNNSVTELTYDSVTKMTYVTPALMTDSSGRTFSRLPIVVYDGVPSRLDISIEVAEYPDYPYFYHEPGSTVWEMSAWEPVEMSIRHDATSVIRVYDGETQLVTSTSAEDPTQTIVVVPEIGIFESRTFLVVVDDQEGNRMAYRLIVGNYPM